MRGEFWRQQYEGLHDLCFEYGKYGHRSNMSPLKLEAKEGEREKSCEGSNEDAREEKRTMHVDEAVEGYEEWMAVQKNRQRAAKDGRGSLGNPMKGTGSQAIGGDCGELKRLSSRGTAGGVDAMENHNNAKSKSKAEVTQSNRENGGSRFSTLNNLTEEEGDREGGASMDTK